MRRSSTIVAYVSGHGYGHYTRASAVLEELGERGFDVEIATSAQALRLARGPGLGGWTAAREVDVGPGTAQRGPLDVDIPATRAALQQHLERFDALADEEARTLEQVGAALVFADVPPLAFEAAARAGVPSVGMGNFSWSWIYEGYAHHDPWFARAAERLRRAEARAGLFLELAMGGGLDVFPRVIPIAPVARRPRHAPALVRAVLAEALGLPADDRPLVVTSFGGFGAALDLGAALSKNAASRFVVVSGPPDLALPNARSFEPSEVATPAVGRTGAGTITHPDLVAAADCLIGKPGYSTVAECLRRPTPFVHVPRGEFREAPPLTAAIERWLPSALLPLSDLHAGRFQLAIDRACAAVPREPPPTPDGVGEAADAIVRFLAERTR